VSHFGLVLASGVVWAGDPELEIEAIAVGDFDCSGSADLAVLSSSEEGDIVVDIALGVPERELPGPFSGEEATVEFADIDGDRCDDLIVTAGSDEVYQVAGVDHPELLRLAGDGEGDSEADLHLERRRPTQIPTIDMGVGLGGFTEWGDWVDDCSQTCTAWVGGTYPCGQTPDGEPRYCPIWRCVAFKLHCMM
jgi:hypothetical protein